MGKDIPLGRIAGIKVGMNITVLAVAALYTVVLATNRFPIEQPGLSRVAYWTAGGAGAFLLFLSLLVHELGHALVAKDEGIGVHSMALTLLGGVTRMESSPATAGAELRVSVVGPLASAACGVALLSGAYVMPNDGLPGLAGHVFAWIGFLNLLLAAFNILPATPLDGGRVLSALIWMRTGSRSIAMRTTAWIGVAAGTGLAGYGLIQVRAHHAMPYGIWFLVIGGFVLMSAVRELQAAPMYSILAGVTVADAMAKRPPSAAAWSTVADFLRTHEPDPDQQAWPVVDSNGHVTSLLTADAIRAVDPARWSHLTVDALAVPIDRVVHLHPEDDLLPALQRVDTSADRHGLVIDDAGLVLGTIDPAALHRTIGRRRAGLATEPR